MVRITLEGGFATFDLSCMEGVGTSRRSETSEARMMDPTKEAGSGEKQPLGPVVQIDEGRIQAHLDGVVRSTVEEALNALLDAEADHLCGTRKYERSEGRKGTRAGSYDRQLHTKAGDVTLTVPKLRSLPFETAII
jgi:hypothetical protein